MLLDLVQNVRIGSYFKVTGSGLALSTVNGLIPGQEAVMSLPQIRGIDVGCAKQVLLVMPE